MNQELLEKCRNADLLKEVAEGKEVVWINENLEKTEDAMAKINITMADIDDAEARLARFAPFLMKKFPETIPTNGLIESPLTYIPNMQKKLEEHYDTKIPGKMFLKQDSHLAISGSVKARGGIYEVLKHAEDLALEHGMLKKDDDYSVFASDEFKEFFSKFKIQVGSTGNLGMSIGIMSAALGFHVIVHMSADAKQWKKDLLRQRGAEVVEYADDYSKAVEVGRKNSDADPNSYFVDDENSVTLFLGYAVAAKRIVKQFAEKNIVVDAEHPLFVYIPCGVGGAPGGVAFGFKKLFGDNVHVFFTEPTQAPCMLVGMASGLQNKVCVKDFGLSGLTHADGLAVGRPSGFVGGVGHLVGPTGGYIWGFLLMAVIYGIVKKLLGKAKFADFIALTAGLIGCYAFGTLWFVHVYTGDMDYLKALSLCVLPFIIPDLIKMFLACKLVDRIKPHIFS